ncbi:MAG: GIY-YIG nuclease family protein [Desulfobacterales bacterium]|nr:MAG: GIY-YIG nuclease family protein [Desulfobacterales bacterium]
MHSLPGTYALVFCASMEKAVNIGKLGTLFLKPGFYVYIGSAFGPGGLRARINHHLNNFTRPHWHMDYLKGCLNLTEIWYTHDRVHREHQWAETLEQTRGASAALPGFGSSGCRCHTHLLFFGSKPPCSRFRRKVHARFSDHNRIMIERPFKKPLPSLQSAVKPQLLPAILADNRPNNSPLP